MRPIKDILAEDSWNIGYRFYNENDSVVNGKQKYHFDLLRANDRYWYADPFLFEKDGKTYLFVEMFDNKTEKGLVGCSEFIDGKFTEPKVVLEEPFHLSYPYVFEKDGQVFMMPETHEDKKIQLYKSVDFPCKWEKCQVIVDDIDAVDSVFVNDMVVASVICPKADMSIDLCAYNLKGEPAQYNPVDSSSLTKRGAGMCFEHKNMLIRPAQSCENGVYGGKVIFYNVVKCDEKSYEENEVSSVSPDNITTSLSKKVEGIHTYARSSKIEIVDIKFKHINLKRIIWIAKRKLKV